MVRYRNAIIILLLCVVSRLPQLLSDNLLLDGDESVVGLMAKHLADGRHIPVYFYGQQYGLSFFEVVPISISYVFLGISDIAVKVTMLLMWTIGTLFFYKTLRQIGSGNKTTALLITLVLIFSPAWAVWSMKARGGYLTSYLLVPVVTYLLFHSEWQRKMVAYLLVGLFLIIIYESQPLWLVGLLPIVTFQVCRSQNVRFAAALLPGLIGGEVLFYFLKQRALSSWSPDVLGIPKNYWETLTGIPMKVYYHETGSYYLNRMIEPHLVTSILAVVTSMSIVVILLITGFSLVRKKKVDPLLYVLAISVLCTIGYVFFLPHNQPRYLLPLTGWVLLMAYLLMDRLSSKVIYAGIFSLFISLGTFSLFTFKDYSFAAKRILITRIIDYLLSEDIHHVFCQAPLLQWQVMFYSKEQVIARYYRSIDRYPEYIDRVEHAMAEGRNVAILGHYNGPIPSRKVLNVEFFRYGGYQYSYSAIPEKTSS